jgi:chemotaxis protein CheC
MSHRLRESHLDALREVAGVGAGHAATALAQMTGRTVQITVPAVRCLPLDQVPAVLGGEETPIAAIHHQVLGAFRAQLLLVLPRRVAARLLEVLLGNAPANWTRLSEMETSALREIGNILSSAYLTAVSRLMDLSLIPTVPAMALDMAGAVADHLLHEVGETSDEALVLETVLRAGPQDLQGRLFLVPHPRSLDRLIGALQEKTR